MQNQTYLNEIDLIYPSITIKVLYLKTILKKKFMINKYFLKFTFKKLI